VNTITDSPPRSAAKAREHPLVWFPTTRAGKVALTLDLVMAAFPLWLLPSWYLVTFLVGAGGMFESPTAVAANSLFQAAVVAGTLIVNLAALLRAKDHSILLALALIPLSAVLAFMAWSAAVNGLPGLGAR
jgi:hypothetical protein